MKIAVWLNKRGRRDELCDAQQIANISQIPFKRFFGRSYRRVKFSSESSLDSALNKNLQFKLMVGKIQLS